jgi:SAM-dependent methyltransferase
MINSLIKYLLKNIYNIGAYVTGNLVINYYRIDYAPKQRAGYTDIDSVVRRYRALGQESLEQLTSNQSIKDNLYFMEHECSEIYNSAPKNATMLDVGCGNGNYGIVFGRKGSPLANYSYWGSEIDKKLTDVCSEIYPDGHFIVSYADNINAANNQFELVFCSSTLHYTLGGWRDSVKEMSRVANRYLCLTRFPVTKYNDTFYVRQTVSGRTGKETHYFVVINRLVLEKYFNSLGFKVIHRDYSSEHYPVNGVEEKIVLVQYCLEKK